MNAPVEVPLRLHSAGAIREGTQPLRVGIPLVRGLLREPVDATVRLGQADPRPADLAVLERWSDGSIRWLLVETLSPQLPAGDTSGICRLVSAPVDREGARPGCTIHRQDDRWRVDCGTVAFTVSCRVFAPFSGIAHAGRKLLTDGKNTTTLRDRRLQQRELLVEHCEIESAAPLRTTLELSGHVHYHRHLCFRARLSFFANTGLVRVDLTLHNSARAIHRGGLWDLGDAGSFFFRNLQLTFCILRGPESRHLWQASPSHEVQSCDAETTVEIYQDSSGGENWQSPNHVSGQGRLPPREQGYRLRIGDRQSGGLRASPIARLEGAGAVLTAALPYFWEQFPKSIALEQGCLCAGLFPNRWDDLYELQGGEQKTHTLWLHVAAGEEPPDDLRWVHQPARLLCEPNWYATQQAAAYLTSRDANPEPRLDEYIDFALQGPKGLFAKREPVDEYGWRHFGDVWADHEQAYYEGPQPVISHYNNQFDMLYGAIYQFMRSGNPRWFDFFEPLARHVMDIDIYHTDQDKAAYNGGMFWFTDHYRDAATSTHRTFSRFNRPENGQPYGGGPGSEHNFARGLRYYYYLTGDPEARQAAISLGDWVINIDDGEQTIFAAVDPGPTGLASLTGDTRYHGPGRGGANSIRALLDAWHLTRQERYLQKAEALIHRCIHPQDDVAPRDLLHAEKRWSYTMFLAALDDYLLLKEEAGQVDENYAYAQQSLLTYARWMLEHERPYFDYPEQLEFPTEAWAAQELRKANVMRLASRHAEAGLDRELYQRGDELAERAWYDLLRFPTRYCTRAIAIIMTEGLVDAAARHKRLPQAVRPEKIEPFPPPQTFVPQKARVKSKLHSPAALGHVARWLLKPVSWRLLLNRVRAG